MMYRRLLCLVLCLLPHGAYAHEFWIEPTQYQVESGATLEAYFKNGENFKGGTVSYFDSSSTRFEMVAAGRRVTLSPRSGDSPALNVKAPVADGLIIVAHETTPARLTYREWAKFRKFAGHKDFERALEDHVAAGWPQSNFRERYTRHAKALIAVGSGAGADTRIGMKTEIVALTNPYAQQFNNRMNIQVLYEGTGRPGAQVEVFEKPRNGAVRVTMHRTDAAGRASIRVKPGHSYLFDAVVLRPAQDTGDQPDRPVLWETYWAALTFAVPR